MSTYNVTLIEESTPRFQLIEQDGDTDILLVEQPQVSLLIAPGLQGAPGATWRAGSGAPNNSLGANGDFYLDTDTGDVYQRNAGVYAVIFTMSPAAAAAVWGNIGGTLSNQLDLQAALNAKQPLDSDLTAIASLTTDSFGRALLTKTDGPSVRVFIGAGTGDLTQATADTLYLGAHATADNADKLDGFDSGDFQKLSGKDQANGYAGVNGSSRVTLLSNVTNDAQIKAGDFPSSSVDGEIALFNGTGGKSLKRATGSGLATVTSGVLGTTANNTSNWDTAYSDRLKWDGGSTGLNAATGRTSLGLVVGTNVEAWSANLDAWSALATSAKQDALGFTPEDVANKDTDGTLAANSDTKYPSQKAVKTYVDNATPTIANASDTVKGITKLSVAPASPTNPIAFGANDPAVELTANKSTNTALGTSDTLYPSQKAVKTYADTKVVANTAITGATKTKITYDSKGLVTAGADATTADIADSTDKRYVTDAELIVLGNTSGTNTGDQTITLTGDVTGSGTGTFATMIANDAVTYAKMQNVSATDKLLGRATAGSGDVEEITCTSFARSILDDADAAAVRSTIGAQPAGSYGDFSSNTSTSVDGEVVLFSGTAGKTGKRATVSGLATLASGVLGATANNSSNWDTAYTERHQWDGGSTNLNASTGRTSLGLVIGTDVEGWLGNPSADGYILSSTTGGTRSWIAPPSGGSQFFVTNAARVDDSGDDGTGAVGDMEKPFLTVQAAIAALEAVTTDGVVYVHGNHGSEDVTTSLSDLTIVGDGSASSPHFFAANSITVTGTSSSSIRLRNTFIGGTGLNFGLDVTSVVVVLENAVANRIIAPSATVQVDGVGGFGLIASDISTIRAGGDVTLNGVVTTEDVTRYDSSTPGAPINVTATASSIHSVAASDPGGVNILTLSDARVYGVNQATTTDYADVLLGYVPTQSPGDDSNKPASTEYVDTAIGAIDFSGYVPTSRTVNGHALSSDVTVTPTDLGLVIGTDVEAWSANLDAWSALATSAKQDHSTNLDGWSALATSAKANSGANTDITSLLLNQTGLVVKGGSANALTIKPNETLSAPRTFNIVTGDANRSFTLNGDLTVPTGGGTLGSAAFTASTAYDAAGAAAAVVSDTAYDATTWNGVTGIAPSKNAVRDWIETLGSAAYTSSSAYDAAGAAAAVVSDTAYNATSWNGVTGIAPSKNAVRDKFESLATDLNAARGNLGMATAVEAYVSHDVSTGSLPDIDGYQTIENDRVYLGAQSNTIENGIWIVHESSAWERPPDFADGNSIPSGQIVYCRGGNGNTQFNSVWIQVDNASNDQIPFTVGTDPINSLSIQPDGSLPPLGFPNVPQGPYLPASWFGATDASSDLGAGQPLFLAAYTSAATGMDFGGGQLVNAVFSGDGSGLTSLSTSQITDSTDKRFVTDAQLTVLGNTSGTNSGDQYGGVTASGALQYLRRNAGNTAYEFGALPDYSGTYQPLDAALTALAAGSDFVQFTGPTTSTKVFTLPNSSATLLYSGGALGTPSSGTLSSCSGLPVSGITASTSTALGVGSIELGHASDTTIARVSAGVVSIEGVNVVTTSSTDELTNKTLNASVGKGTWTASGTWTLPAFTLGGTVSGGGNQLNNVIIGTSTPLAGSFTLVTASKAGLALDVTNSTDGTSNQVAKFSGTNATRANNDLIYDSYFLANSAGTQKEFVRLNFKAPTVTSTSEDGSFIVSLMSAGTLTDTLTLTKNSLSIGTSNAFTTGTIELGAASDTTIARSSAGHISVEGSTVGLASDNLGFFAVSTSAAIGVGTVELGHASDTTLSRSSAGVLAVEGVVVPTISSSNTLTNKKINLAAGGTGAAPFNFASGTVATTPVAGDMEYDGVVHYGTAVASERAVINEEQFITTQGGSYTLANQTAAQKMFNSPTNGAVTVGGSRSYQFECQFDLSSMSGTSGTFGFALGGTATFTYVKWWSAAVKVTPAITAVTQLGGTMNTTSSNTALTANNTNTVGYATIKGIMRINAGGTVIPQVSLSQAAAAVVGQDSYFKLSPLGSNTVVSIGNWS